MDLNRAFNSLGQTFNSALWNPFNFPEPENLDLSLQSLASNKFALYLWRDKIRIMWNSSTLSWIDEFRCRDVLVAPPRLEDMIDDRIVSIGNDLQSWLAPLLPLISEIGLTQNLSFEQQSELLLELFDSIVFKPNNTICFKRTVRNMLTNAQLTPVSKYKIACQFCIKDCVNETWPSVKKDLSVLGKSPLVLYWNELKLKKGPENPDEKQLATLLNVDKNVSAFDYFWRRMGMWREFGELACKILKNSDIVAIKFLLPTLNFVEILRVCIQIGDYIFGKLIEKDEYFEFAQKSWSFMKGFIPENIFDGIIRRLWLCVFNYSEPYTARQDRNGAFLSEVWTDASDRLKSHVINSDKFVQLFDELDTEVRGVASYDLKFMFELLASVNFEVRNTVWMNHWCKLIVRAKPSELEEFMRLCLANNEEIEQFKDKRMTNFEELEQYFGLCVERGFYTELYEYLNYFAKDPRRLENLSKEIILSNLHHFFSCGEDDFAMCHLFIHQTFRESQKANTFMEELVMAPQCLGFVHCKLDEGCFHQVINIICQRFPTSEKNLKELKRGFLDYCNRNLARGRIGGFDLSKFNYFFNWCSSDDATIRKFKQSLNIDDIFEIVVNDIFLEQSTLSRSRLLLNLANFLDWYFGSPRAAKIFKTSKMRNYEESGALKTALQEGSLRLVNQLLRWAFDNDIEMNANVRAKLRRFDNCTYGKIDK